MRFKQYLCEGDLTDMALSKNWSRIRYSGTLVVDSQNLTSLKGCPSLIQGDFQCRNNLLENLEGGPKEVIGNYHADHNVLTSLKGIAKRISGNVYLNYNPTLKTFKDIHKQIEHIGGYIYLTSNKSKPEDQTYIDYNVLGVILINGLQKIVCTDDWAVIVNKHIGHGRQGILECQTELIEAGLEEYAQL